jgi:cation transport regulator ChaB
MTDLTKRPASAMRTFTAQVRDHLSAAQHLQEQYFAALKRAEAQYTAGMKRITDALEQASQRESVPSAPGSANSGQPDEQVTPAN